MKALRALRCLEALGDEDLNQLLDVEVDAELLPYLAAGFLHVSVYRLPYHRHQLLILLVQVFP